jgi:hypothetical protein
LIPPWAGQALGQADDVSFGSAASASSMPGAGLYFGMTTEPPRLVALSSAASTSSTAT